MLQILLSLLVIQVASGPPAAQTGGTASIRGRITDRETGQPIPRALGELQLPDGRRIHARADDEGRYEFTGLPAGRYVVSALAGEHRSTHLRQTYRENGSNPASGSGIVLAHGESRAGVNIALPRALAIWVRVVDDRGEPLAGASIRVRSPDGAYSPGRPDHTTDDRGLIRMFGLAPGRYIFCAEGIFVQMTAPRSAPRKERMVATCYPSVFEADAEPLLISPETTDEITIQMRWISTVTISGVVLDASGVPPAGARLVFNRFEGRGSSGGTAQLAPDGWFTIPDVAPGEYELRAEIGSPNEPTDRREHQLAVLPLTVEDADVSDLMLVMSKAARVAGRIVFEDGPAPARPANYPPMLVRALRANDPIAHRRGPNSAVVREDFTFELDRLVDALVLDVLNLPRGWFIKAMRYKDRDIIDRPTTFETSTDPDALKIMLSRRGAMVHGRVWDDRGVPVAAARVVMFPEDRSRWNRFELLRTVRSSQRGAFRTLPQRGGTYYVAALEGREEPPNEPDRAYLERLAALAERVMLLDGEELPLDLRIVRLR